ncbi:EF-hand domain-containing protein [Kitasatospora sp. NPDC004272]
MGGAARRAGRRRRRRRRRPDRPGRVPGRGAPPLRRPGRPAGTLRALCDRDDDGRVTAEEFTRFHRALGLPPGTAGLAFERLDLDGDGTLSVAELAAALWEFWTSEDAGALGNWLFGDAFLTAAG